MLLLGLVCCLPMPVRGDMWTNVAGHAVELDLIDLQGNMATFERPDGQPFRLPLASLCVTDRARARLEWHQVAIPIGLRPAYNQCRRQLKRLTRLRQAKRLAQDDYVVYRRGFVVHFKAACMRLKLTEENRSRIIMTLSGY
ncbi:MAG: hypothetical protein HN383_03460 [Verrucomicrobia bacterium]|nr:hypothetical protein [Verrucomicrobiota bacterium]MBT7699330.1 hypothetical protein [Verrucomicrobiota bacterium]